MTIPGGAQKQDDGRDLVQEFLWSVAGRPEGEAAAIAGVSVATLQRWRRCGPQRLRGDIRRRLIEHLEKEAAARAAA